ncbi:MAG: fimbrillin family protein [Alistipes sp.]
MRKLFVTMAIAAIGFAACSKDVGTTLPGEMRVAIDPTITRATETDFVQNDAIGVTITTSKASYADNKKFVFGADNKFVAEDNLLWYEDINEKSSLFAYYPYHTTAPTEFTVAADQNGAGYEASNFMSALKTNVLPSIHATPMTFKHKMVRLIINITNETAFAVEKIVVTNTIGTAAINLTENTISAKAGGALLGITAREITPNVKYMALIVPQSAAVKIAVTTAEGTRTQGFNESVLESGKQYPLTVRVLPKDIILSLGGPIDGWIDGDELLPDGQNPPVDNTIEYGGVKYKIVVTKDGNVWMAENLRYIPAGKTPSLDPTSAAGIWYPIVLKEDATPADPKKPFVAEGSSDPKLIETNGLLYDFSTASGLEISESTINASNSGIRGICPEGWHLPTLADLNSLADAYPDAEGKGASIAALNTLGFNCVYTGLIAKNTSALVGKWSPATGATAEITQGTIMSSEFASFSVKAETQAITSKHKCFMYLVSQDRLMIADNSDFAGVSVRCVKDKK